MRLKTNKIFIFGFTLIELMVVVAIVGILSAVALPNYRNYVARGRLAATMPILDALKTSATDYYNTNGTWPATLAAMGLTAADYINSVAVPSIISGVSVGSMASCGAANTMYGATGGTTPGSPFCISLTYNVAFGTATTPVLGFLVFPTADANLLNWLCYTYVATAVVGSIPTSYLPGGCAPSPS